MSETMSERARILAALSAFASQRAGLEFCNYGDWKAYRSEQRAITKDLHDFNKLMSSVSWRDSITAMDLRAAFRNAYSGRLSIEDRPDGSIALSYCTGQYFPTEYRKAACAVLASALWAYVRDGMGNNPADPIPPGQRMRNTFRREFGARLQRRYFD